MRLSVIVCYSHAGLNCRKHTCIVVNFQAIRDGVIEATIDHEKGYVQSRETSDVYKTREPMAAFHQRIAFCLDIHNNSVKVCSQVLKCIHNFSCHYN